MSASVAAPAAVAEESRVPWATSPAKAASVAWLEIAAETWLCRSASACASKAWVHGSRIQDVVPI